MFVKGLCSIPVRLRGILIMRDPGLVAEVFVYCYLSENVRALYVRAIVPARFRSLILMCIFPDLCP